MICRGFASTHDGLDVRPIVRFLRHSEEPACAGCREALTRIGADWRFGRSEDRPFTPRWLQNLQAKDMTDRSAA